METEGGIARYRIEAEIAHSSLCTIYRAYEESLARPVLIKKLHPQMAREEDIRKRFEREAQVCARVKHENIVDIYSYQADLEAVMLVMEFVEGESLGDLLKREGRLDWQAALAMLGGVLKGLGHAHSKGVTHRDIKPDNLLIAHSGHVKITDFGLATIADSTRMTMQGAVVGTPAYLPPEQVSGSPLDHRGDLFSVGVTFYEVLTGISPFSGQSFSDTLKRILTYSPPAPSSLVPEIPPEFDQIIARLLEKQPSRRYATAEQALEDVKRLAALKGVGLDPAAILSALRPESGNGSGHPRTIPILPPELSFLRKSVPIWGLGFAAVAAASLIFFLPSMQELRQDLLPKLKESPGITADRISQAVKAGPAPSIPDTTGLTGAPPSEVVRNTPEEIIVTNPRIVEPGTPSRGSAPPPETPAQGEGLTTPGKLSLNIRPWAAVTIDNISYGQSPFTAPIELPPGRHLVALTNPEFPSSYVETVDIPPGGMLNLDVNLWSLVGVVKVLSVKPWAEIFVDGDSYGTTPRAKPIILSFGKHILELRNPAYQLWKQEIELSLTRPTLEISETLTPLQE